MIASTRGAPRFLGRWVAPVAFFLLVAPGAGAAQARAGFIYDGTGLDTLAFGGQRWVLLHIAADSSVTSEGPLVRGEPMGTLAPHPAAPEGPARGWLDSAMVAYEAGAFRAAAEAADSGLTRAPNNPQLLNAAARARFRVPNARGRSLTEYERLMAVLDEQRPEPDLVVVDPHFAEAYGKLGALYLDAGRYAEAARVLTRADLAARALGAPVEFRVQQLSHLVEAYTELGEADVARRLAAETLRLDPRNQYVLPYLERIGPGSEGPLECRAPGEGLPDVGLYALFANRQGGNAPAPGEQLLCVAPQEDGDGSLRPCLRIGRVHIGQAESDVVRVLSEPFRDLAYPDGTRAYAHLVFSDEAADAGAYYVLAYEDVAGERVVSSIQLTGDAPPLPFSFSCLGLGASADDVARQLGRPASTESFTDETRGLSGQVWVYDTAPVSIELVEGRVYSIRATRPPELEPRVLRLKGLSPH